MGLIEKFENEDTKYHAKLSTYIQHSLQGNMSKTPKQNFPESNRFLLCYSLQTWVNDQEVNSSFHWKNFTFIYQLGLYLNYLVSDAI